MPNRVQWNPDYSTGSDTLDGQHKAMLAQCNALADCLGNVSPQNDEQFNIVFKQLMVQAHEHFATEAALLTQCAYPMLEEHQNERDEFDYLANDIITAENFESIELQRFLALWWVGHIAGSCKKYRAFLDKAPAA